MEDVFNKKWEIHPCGTGEDCWCRLITLEGYKDKYKDDDLVIVGSAALNKTTAEYLVKLHNDHVERNSIIMKTYRFDKDPDNKWYVVLPEWKGSRAELQMVMGADTMLDIMSEGLNHVNLTLSLVPFEGCDHLTKLHNTPEVGGAMYKLEKYRGIEFNLEMWLCSVTEFVFGHLPEKIYLA